VPGSRLHGGLANCYKIKLRKQGYRLVYTVEDDALIVLVLALDKREDLAAYKSAIKRLLAKLTPTGTGEELCRRATNIDIRQSELLAPMALGHPVPTPRFAWEGVS
jgi:hypothetical protein